MVQLHLVPGAVSSSNKLEGAVCSCCHVRDTGASWARKKILFHCDNAAVEDIWQKRSCKSPAIMMLVRTLYYLAASGNYHVGIAHISGTDNCTADHLSCFSMQAFCKQGPEQNPAQHHWSSHHLWQPSNCPSPALPAPRNRTKHPPLLRVCHISLLCILRSLPADPPTHLIGYPVLLLRSPGVHHTAHNH